MLDISTGLVREIDITCFLNNFVENKEINCVLIYDNVDKLEIFMIKKNFKNWLLVACFTQIEFTLKNAFSSK